MVQLKNPVKLKETLLFYLWIKKLSSKQRGINYVLFSRLSWIVYRKSQKIKELQKNVNFWLFLLVCRHLCINTFENPHNSCSLTCFHKSYILNGRDSPSDTRYIFDFFFFWFDLEPIFQEWKNVWDQDGCWLNGL
jgi:hypothetical protein